MHNNKLMKCVILFTTLCFLTSCSPTANESTASVMTTTAISETSAPGTAATTLPAGITYSTDQDGRTVAAGTTPEGIPISAVVMANRDLQNPGEASSYEIRKMNFSESDRGLLAGQDWTLVESTTNDEYYEGTLYYDVYRDTQNRQWEVNVFPSQLMLYTANGSLLSGLAAFSSEQPKEQQDFPFAAAVEAYQEAQDAFSNAGFTVSDCYDVCRYPYTWLEKNAKLLRVGGDDMTEYDRLYPDGLSPEDGACFLNLRQDINGLPLLTGDIGKLLNDGQVPLEKDEERSMNSFTQAIVTNQGLEFLIVYNSFLAGDVIETGEMVNFEDALHTASQNFFSGNPNDGLNQQIYQYCMQDSSVNGEGNVSPDAPQYYQPTNGSVSIEKAELGLLPLAKGEDTTYRAIPCWEFLFVWHGDPNDPISATSTCWAAVNALTGEYIPATTVMEEDLG